VGDCAYGDTGHPSWRCSIPASPTWRCRILPAVFAGQDESTWVLTSYLVSNAIVLPLSGWLSSIMGRKRFGKIKSRLVHRQLRQLFYRTGSQGFRQQPWAAGIRQRNLRRPPSRTVGNDVPLVRSALSAKEVEVWGTDHARRKNRAVSSGREIINARPTRVKTCRVKRVPYEACRMKREYQTTAGGVGAVIVKESRVLLIRRGTTAAAGRVVVAGRRPRMRRDSARSGGA